MEATNYHMAVSKVFGILCSLWAISIIFLWMFGDLYHVACIGKKINLLLMPFGILILVNPPLPKNRDFIKAGNTHENS